MFQTEVILKGVGTQFKKEVHVGDMIKIEGTEVIKLGFIDCRYLNN